MNETYYGKFEILDIRFLDQIPFNNGFSFIISNAVFDDYPEYDKMGFGWDGIDVNLRCYKNGVMLENIYGFNNIDAFLQNNPKGVGMLEFSSMATPDEDIRDGLISGGYLKLDENVTTMFVYLMNSPKNKVSKSLNWVSTMEIKINRVINNKNLIVDIANIDEESKKRFNYVYLPFMNRYYYVQEISLLKDFTSCSLVEDVLMSFSDLIRSQTAFVERQENSYDPDKVDNLVSIDYDKTVTYESITPTNDVFMVTNQETSTATGGYWFLTVVG